jgi:hypothetical protein
VRGGTVAGGGGGERGATKNKLSPLPTANFEKLLTYHGSMETYYTYKPLAITHIIGPEQPTQS